MNQPNFGLDKIIKSSTFSTYCQEIARFRLASMINSENAKVSILPVKPDQHQGHWMAVIMAASNSFRLTLRITYSIADATILASMNRNEPNVLMDAHQVHDFMREFSNQLIGGLKNCIETQSGYAKTSLPLVTHAVDAEFFGPNPSVAYFEDSWMLKMGEVQTHCAVTFEFFDRNFKSKVYLPAFYDADAVSEIEFFF